MRRRLACDLRPGPPCSADQVLADGRTLDCDGTPAECLPNTLLKRLADLDARSIRFLDGTFEHSAADLRLGRSGDRAGEQIQRCEDVTVGLTAIQIEVEGAVHRRPRGVDQA